MLQGTNPPRVKPAGPGQIVAAMRANGLTVSYIVFPDECHGFARPQNRIDANAPIVLARHPGGSAAPLPAIPGRTAPLHAVWTHARVYRCPARSP
jgi:hypothetical protein